MRVLLAHDTQSRTCDGLRIAIESAMPGVEVVDAASVEDARLLLPSLAPDAALVCLDLPPAPLGGIRIARHVLRDGHPLVLVTRSLRWLPPHVTELRRVPWVTPEATVDEVAQAIEAARAATTTSVSGAPPAEKSSVRAVAPPPSEHAPTGRPRARG